MSSARPSRRFSDGRATPTPKRVKDLTRGRNATLEDFQDLFADLDVPAEVRAELEALTPAGYTGFADELVDEL